ncbi:MAG: hypothetical protein JJE28_06470 [Actinomycetales bacterium]|nr:hypothetical protein [Actinomycetales bacterium]
MDPAQSNIDAAPIPTTKELRRQRNLFVQLVRFLHLNINMYLLAKRGH